MRCLQNVIVAGEAATFHDLPHFAGGIVPGDGIFSMWSYRAGAGRAEAFLLNPQPLTARVAHDWGVVTEVVPKGKALSRARELAELYLKVPEVTRCNTRVHFICPLRAHCAGGWLWAVARRSIRRRPREVNADRRRTCRFQGTSRMNQEAQPAAASYRHRARLEEQSGRVMRKSIVNTWSIEGDRVHCSRSLVEQG